MRRNPRKSGPAGASSDRNIYLSALDRDHITAPHVPGGAARHDECRIIVYLCRSHSKRPEYALLHEGAERLSAHVLNDLGEQQVIAVRVAPLRPGVKSSRPALNTALSMSSLSKMWNECQGVPSGRGRSQYSGTPLVK
jgi:hypothetical protein